MPWIVSLQGAVLVKNMKAVICRQTTSDVWTDLINFHQILIRFCYDYLKKNACWGLGDEMKKVISIRYPTLAAQMQNLFSPKFLPKVKMKGKAWWLRQKRKLNASKLANGRECECIMCQGQWSLGHNGEMWMPAGHVWSVSTVKPLI